MSLLQIVGLPLVMILFATAYRDGIEVGLSRSMAVNVSKVESDSSKPRTLYLNSFPFRKLVKLSNTFLSR